MGAALTAAAAAVAAVLAAAVFVYRGGFSTSAPGLCFVRGRSRFLSQLLTHASVDLLCLGEGSRCQASSVATAFVALLRFGLLLLRFGLAAAAVAVATAATAAATGRRRRRHRPLEFVGH